ncbi:glycosyltransferase family 4 protein [Tenacibaculum finnmarkense]|uniref:glycosyltransferase family 4 protein n=1 Tax=Tenacibaculum finnmarkense TaxID=2781243 RepID=UPI001E357816|nr:glycosyltransferase family 4 protein [Tenacibaculum finnmarkense]MCD8400506.1 glycosyltransferase family 4 protein [Tenacibaculum finnmarkense genomovar ulcerans]MCG8785888.1 glycosyltransferase family 4 protein [Tenacibaculum finnmarkense]MCG8813605.1 glycosyltransferase family 4 protein [Tenacibaculum finnmarkense]
MNILYIHQYFKTPKEPGGTRSYWIAKELLKKGHSVTMLTTSSQIEEKVKKENIDGIDVIYLKVPYNQKMSILTRLKSFFSFMIKSTYIALKVKNIDLVIATSTPLTIGFPALVLKFFKKIPYLFEVRDLWPEVPIQMGGLNNKFLQKLAIGFEKIIYKKALHIIALSPGMEKGVLKFVSQKKVSMIPNMAKIDAFFPRDKNFKLLESLNLKKESFKVIHFGALGLANGAHTIINTAKLLKDNNEIEFIFIGGGATEADLIKECDANNLKNVKFLGRFAMSETAEIVNFCHVSIVSFLDLPILYTNSPNKLFDSLSAGKPILVNSAGWTKDLVEKYNCGFYANPKHPQELADKIIFLKNNIKEREIMSQNSRNLAETKYDKSILCAQFADIVAGLKL